MARNAPANFVGGGRRGNTFKFAPSCFELADMAGRCAAHNISRRLNVVIWSVTGRRRRGMSDDRRTSAAGINHIRVRRVSASHNCWSRGRARNAVGSYTRHHVIKPCGFPHGSDQTVTPFVGGGSRRGRSDVRANRTPTGARRAAVLPGWITEIAN